ncbi:MAG TPA: hypothetical protein VG738_09220 [Chitinophagaceae bacterium]|nr:hypothetical protein [Chitinophagaceae bacterium]
MSPVSILKNILVASLVMVVLAYGLYAAPWKPFGLQAAACLAAAICIAGAVVVVARLRKPLLVPPARNDVSAGLYTGLLWTVEIGMNNIIQPELPLRDTLDDCFWAVIALVILYLAIRRAMQSGKLMAGIYSGFITGLATGAVACTTGLLLVCFGMHLLTTDPANIAEWADIGIKSGYPGIAEYFAFQTMAGALLHLIALGVVMGALLGMIGGCTGWLGGLISSKKNYKRAG